MLLDYQHDNITATPGVTLTEDFMRKIGALKGRIGYDKLVSNEYPPR